MNPAERRPTQWTQAGIILLVLTALLANIWILTRVLRTPPKDDLTQYEARFENLKRTLPPQAVVGYFFENADWKRWDYFYTQYALAPTIVDKNPDHSLVIGNFPEGAVSPIAATNSRFVLVKDFGDGVMLFRNEAK